MRSVFFWKLYLGYFVVVLFSAVGVWFLITRDLHVSRWVVILVALTMAGATLVHAYLLARSVTGPIRSLTQAARSLAVGDYPRRVSTFRGDEIGELASAFDIMKHELRETTGTITRDHAMLLTILGGMVEGVVAVDRRERVIHMNAVAGEILGNAPHLSVGRAIWEVTRVTGISETLRRALKEVAEVKAEANLVAPGRDQIIEMVASPLRNGDQRLAGAVVVLHDVTELRNLVDVRRDFVANVSHELKTPITAIRGFAETLVEEPEMSPAIRRRFITKVRDQSLVLSALVSDLLTLARLESETGELEFDPVDLRDPVRRSVRALLPTAEARSVTVISKIPENRVDILGDPEGLEQAIRNLLDNAIKYTPRAGSIDVRVYTDDQSAYVEVEDTGLGIERRLQERIFERFYRIDKARSRELGGTGLGLSIVKHACMAHGGAVSVESTPGRGSLFRVRLPLATNSNG